MDKLKKYEEIAIDSIGRNNAIIVVRQILDDERSVYVIKTANGISIECKNVRSAEILFQTLDSEVYNFVNERSQPNQNMLVPFNISEKSKQLFVIYAKALRTDIDTLISLAIGDQGRTKKDSNNLTQLKKANLIKTFIDNEDNTVIWASLTETGIAYAKSLGIDEQFKLSL